MGGKKRLEEDDQWKDLFFYFCYTVQNCWCTYEQHQKRLTH